MLVVGSHGGDAAQASRLVQSAALGEAVGDIDHVVGVDATTRAGQHDAGDLDCDLVRRRGTS